MGSKATVEHVFFGHYWPPDAKHGWVSSTVICPGCGQSAWYHSEAPNNQHFGCSNPACQIKLFTHSPNIE